MELVPYLVVIPLGAAFLITLAGNRARIAEILSCVAALGLVAISIVLSGGASSRGILVYKVGGWAVPSGITLVVDSFSMLMLIMANAVAFLILIYATDYIKKFTDEWKFYALFMLMLAGTNGVLAAGDIFNMYIFLEIAAIAAYFLVAFGVDAEGVEAAFKYAVMGSVASIFILLGISFLYSAASTLNMADMSSLISSGSVSPKAVQFAAVLFLAGFGLKAALAPFHAWLPYAHSAAPAPVSAMLSGVIIKVLGIYALARIFFNVFGISPALSGAVTCLAVISMIAGAVMAFGQSDIKRLFAYSSVSQIGYIALGLGVGTPLAVTGSLFYLVNHSVFKSLLFLDSGLIEKSSGTRDLARIRGIIKDEPVTGWTTLIAAMSISGVPPFGGFWAKLIIIVACFQANRPMLAAIAIIVSIMTLAYYFRALTPVLFGPRKDAAGPGERARTALLPALSVIILAILTACAAFMLVPGAGNVLLKNASAVLSSGAGYAAAVTESLK